MKSRVHSNSNGLTMFYKTNYQKPMYKANCFSSSTHVIDFSFLVVGKCIKIKFNIESIKSNVKLHCFYSKCLF